MFFYLNYFEMIIWHAVHEILLPDKKELSFIPLPENGPWCPIAVFIEDAVEDGTASDDDKDGGDENICCSNGDISNLLHNTNNIKIEGFLFPFTKNTF